MHISLALIADEANVTDDGKLNVLGVFDRLHAPEFPATHPKLVFVFRLHAEYADAGREVPLRVRLMDEDGEPLFEAQGSINAPSLEPGEFSATNQIFVLVGLRFPRPGGHKFVVNVGDLPAHETPLQLALIPQASAD